MNGGQTVEEVKDLLDKPEAEAEPVVEDVEQGEDEGVGYEPTFSITPRMLANIAEATEAKTIVERSRILPQREAILRQRAAVRMAHTSTKIEGNPLAEYEVEKVLSGEQVYADEQSIFEVQNYNKALLLLDEISKKDRFDSSDILKIHKITMRQLAEEQKRGRWRPNQIYIVTAHQDVDELHYTGPEAGDVPGLVDEAVNWLFDTAPALYLHPILAAGIFHFLFESIHPFTDGNGRVGRLLVLLYLMQQDWDFKKLITLENYFSANREQYIKELEKTGETFGEHLKADLTEWLEFFTTAFLAEAERVKDQILPITLAADEGQSQVYLDKEQLKLLDFLATMGQLTSSDAADVLGIPKRTAQFKIKELVEAGVIKANGKGPATFYTLARS